MYRTCIFCVDSLHRSSTHWNPCGCGGRSRRLPSCQNPEACPLHKPPQEAVCHSRSSTIQSVPIPSCKVPCIYYSSPSHADQVERGVYCQIYLAQVHQPSTSAFSVCGEVVYLAREVTFCGKWSLCPMFFWHAFPKCLVGTHHWKAFIVKVARVESVRHRRRRSPTAHSL